jgi:hypothetical protein
VAIVAEVSAENWWGASIPAKELPVGQAVPRRLVNVRIPRILIRMQERAEEVPRRQRREFGINWRAPGIDLIPIGYINEHHEPTQFYSVH